MVISSNNELCSCSNNTVSKTFWQKKLLPEQRVSYCEGIYYKNNYRSEGICIANARTKVIILCKSRWDLVTLQWFYAVRAFRRRMFYTVNRISCCEWFTISKLIAKRVLGPQSGCSQCRVDTLGKLCGAGSANTILNITRAVVVQGKFNHFVTCSLQQYK